MLSTDRNRFAPQKNSMVISAVLLLLFCSAHSSGQTTQSTTDKMTPSGIAPGAPAGSYSLSGMESINLYNGNLDFRLPLLSLDGRGSAVRTMTLSLNTKKWRVRESHTQTNDTFTPTTLNWGSVDVGYLAGKLLGRQSGWGSRTCPNPQQTRFYYTNTNLTFVAPDGTEYALRDQATDGQPMVANQCGGIDGASRGTVFKTSDGSGITFISDITISDKTTIPTSTVGSWNLIVSGYLLLRDGTRYRIDSGNVSWIRDPNGNLVYSQTDAINHQITLTTLPDGSDQITYKGYQGALRTITITHTLLGSALRTGYSLQTQAQLFPELLGGYNFGTYNPNVVSSVILPDGRSYQFFYNSYGELARVVLPTGGAIEYDMTAGSGVIQGSGSYGFEYQIYRRVIERRTYVDGATLEGRSTYTSNGSTTTVSHYNSAGALLACESHSYSGNAAGSLFAPVEGGFYSDWHEGKELSTTYYAADGVTALKTIVNTWAQRAPVSWYPSQWSNAGNEPENDPRITQTVTTLVDTNQVSKTTYNYDQYNNQTDSYEYDYGTGAAGALVRHTHTDYVTTNPVNGIDYTATSIYLRSLPAQSSVFDAGGVERVRTSFEYDNYTADGNHWSLTDRASISGHDTGFTTGYATRGNVTATTCYLLTNGTVTGSIRAYSQFDIAGNVTKMIDGRGYATTIDYDDHFGAPDGDARSNAAPSELAGLSSFAFATKLTNALGQTVYAQYDYYLGRPVDGEDVNGVVASGYYDDPLDRPKQVRRAVATSVASQSTFGYDDQHHSVTVTTNLNTNNDNALRTTTMYDGFGRTTETQQYEDGTNYIAVQTQYDGLGRAYKTSNPFRPLQSETIQWTITGFDGMGRVKLITSPDNAVVSTDYTGNTTTVTDQAGKARKSVTDALGRLIELYEDPAGLNYQTSYTYDVLDNLVKVTQGSQQRFFMYDSLKRLIRARNPEQATLAALNLADPITGNSDWSTSYQYDPGGNLTQKTDARGVTSTYGYDALNRNTSIDYSDSTLDVVRQYDLATNGKGRLSQVSQNGTTTSATYIDSYDALGRPLIQRQLFQTGGVWSSSYQTERSYDLAGNVTSQKYPSGHTVNYSYDAASRISSFVGNLGDGASRSYASSMLYNARSQLTQQLFGTQIPLYQKLHYNIRGQLYGNRLSTYSLQANEWDWNRGSIANYFTSDYSWGGSGPGNNSNVTRQQCWIPSSDSLTAWHTTEDTFTYDSLNRLKSMTEAESTQNGYVGSSFTQTFDYDRFGNRTINQAGTTQLAGVNRMPTSISATTNRLFAPGETDANHSLINYDAAGNQIKDYYSVTGQNQDRAYDAENRMSTATVSYTGGSTVSSYSYNGDGQRVRRNIGGSETWQIYGMDGELLAEYESGAATFLPVKEYGYRDGALLVTMSSGDVQRLNRFVKNLYYNALGRDASATELQQQMSTLGQAGTQGEAQLLTSAKQVARGLFESSEYIARGRTDSQYVTDLYNAYLQRGPDTAGLNFWVNNTQMYGRGATLNAFEVSTEFATLASTVYGTASSDSQRVEHFVSLFYNGALQREPTSTELQQQTQRLNNAAALGQSQVITEARTMGGEIFQATNYNSNHTLQEYVTDLYEAFLQRAPDGPGLSFWVNNTNSNGRAATLAAFEASTEYGELAGTLYRETFWLVSDQLGTPRMIVDRTGTLAGIKRHDYLPFGEELMAPVSGRSATWGYSGALTVRQQFTQKERDIETGLDYFGYRYFSAVHGRFLSVDPKAVTAENFVNPQRWNSYAYVNNNPLTSQDPDGGQGKGKGGDKIISVFLDQHLEPSGSREPRLDTQTKKILGYENPWEDVKGSKEYAIQLYGSAGMTGVTNMPAASYNFEQALQSSELTIYVGHGAGQNYPGSDAKPFIQEGIVMDSAFYTSDGNHLLINGAQSGVILDKPTVTSAVVVNFSCDASAQGGSYFNFTGKGQVMITINSGNNGITNTATLEKAAAAFVKTYVTTKGNYVRAAKAASAVISKSVKKYPTNRGDAVEVKQVN